MDEPATIRTGRGVYAIGHGAAVERSPDAVIATISLEHSDGIEKVAFRCRIATALLEPIDPDFPNELIKRLAPWIEHEFEQIREAALKTIRAEHRLLEFAFDLANPGPF